jgi:uncharacterized membrane protein
MDHGEKLQLIWALCFVISGIVFALAFFFTNISGVYAGMFAALGYIILYLGLSMAFLIVFSGMNKISLHLASTLEKRKEEVLEIQRELKGKYLKKKIDESAYRRLMERYESELTEIDVKLKEMKRGSKS